jgi:Na+/H+ antiporter NhaD/arsenite permease-like protein
MFTLMLVIFIVGYGFIVFEHINHINKAAIAIFIGAAMWAIYAIGGEQILDLGYSSSWQEFTHNSAGHTSSELIHFITHNELFHHLSQIASIILFLIGAMTVVEVVDRYQGFRIIVKLIQTVSKVRLLWIISFLTFFMSAILDNLTTTIVMVTLLSKLLTDKKNRWLFAGMVIIAANAGGAFSPIGDVTTIMLWIGGQITTIKILFALFIPSLLSMIVPLVILSFIVKGNIGHPTLSEDETSDFIPYKDRITILIFGVSVLVFVPVFKTFTHLPPFMGILLGLGLMWIYTDRKLKGKLSADHRKLCISHVIKQVDIPTILFFLGILSAVSALQSAGHLDIMARFLDEKVHYIYAINLIIGVLSSVVDNVPLVAASIGMYGISPVDSVDYAQHFIQDGQFWTFLAYCAGTGGSILIVGSAAGVAAMGMENIDFVWYLKNISWLALIGYLAGAGAFWIQNLILL